MTGFPNSPKLIKAGLVLLDFDTGALVRVIALQYNPDTLTRSLQPKFMGETTDRSEATRLKGAPVETIKLDAEIDASDQLEGGDDKAAQVGIHPQLAVLEQLAYPTSAQLQQQNANAKSGVLEVAPMTAPLVLFVWSKNRVVPVRLTDFSITEEAFDPALNPIRAKVSIGMRVLSVDDLGFDGKGGSLYMIYQQQKEKLAAMSQSAPLSALGLSSVP